MRAGQSIRRYVLISALAAIVVNLFVHAFLIHGQLHISENHSRDLVTSNHIEHDCCEGSLPGGCIDCHDCQGDHLDALFLAGLKTSQSVTPYWIDEFIAGHYLTCATLNPHTFRISHSSRGSPPFSLFSSYRL